MADIAMEVYEELRAAHVESQMRRDYLFAAINFKPEEEIIPRLKHLIPEIWQSIRKKVKK